MFVHFLARSGNLRHPNGPKEALKTTFPVLAEVYGTRTGKARVFNGPVKMDDLADVNIYGENINGTVSCEL